MKKFITILAVICYGNVLLAQDLIILKSSEEIKAVVQEIGLNDVKYKKYENPNGPTYTLLKANIFMIKYENGNKDVFNEVTERKLLTQAVSEISLNPKMLQTEENFWTGTQVVDYTGRVLKRSEIRSLMAATPDALAAYNSSVTMKTIAIILNTGGMGAMLYNLCFNRGADSYLVIYGVGVTCVVVGLSLDMAGNSKRKKSVDFYNNSLDKSYASSLRFGLTNSGGIGFTLNF